MGLMSELYITKKNITSEDWNNLINKISDYNGLFKKWKIIIKNYNNQLRFYLDTICNVPPTFNSLDTFLIKKTDKIDIYDNYIAIPIIKNKLNNIIDIINYYEIKDRGILDYLEVCFFKIPNRVICKINFYINKNGVLRKYRLILKSFSSLLAIDFESNKRYFYKSAPKYLDINKVLSLLNTDSSSSLLSIDTFPYLQGEFFINQYDYDFFKHSVIFGSSGCGKSKFISSFINNIYKNNNLNYKYKFIVIDPHGSLEDDIGGHGRVIDFKSKCDSIDLFIKDSNDVISSCELLLDLLKSLMKSVYNSKLERVLRHSIYLLLVDENFSFVSLRKLLLDLEYRTSLINKHKFNLPSSIIDFFLSDFNDLKTKSYSEAISPIISFIDEMEMVPVFNEISPNKLIDTIMKNFLTIFSLDMTNLGNKVIKTISGLIMQQLFTVIQKRQFNEHIILIVDEVSVVENSILLRFLSEARKYNLSIILVGQYFNQVSDDLKNAIFANVINYYMFRVSKLDANILVDNFNMKIPLDDTKDKKIKLLTQLNDRECICRISKNSVLLPAFKGKTLDFTSIPRIKNKDIDKKVSNISLDNGNKKSFKLDMNINLKDVLIKTSSSRKDDLNE